MIGRLRLLGIASFFLALIGLVIFVFYSFITSLNSEYNFLNNIRNGIEDSQPLIYEQPNPSVAGVFVEKEERFRSQYIVDNSIYNYTFLRTDQDIVEPNINIGEVQRIIIASNQTAFISQEDGGFKLEVAGEKKRFACQENCEGISLDSNTIVILYESDETRHLFGVAPSDVESNTSFLGKSLFAI